MIQALRLQPEWCQQFLINGTLKEEAMSDRQSIEDWLNMSPAYYPGSGWKVLLWSLPTLTILSWLLFLWGPLPYWPAVTFSLIQLTITGNQSKKINARHSLISKRADTLKKYYNLIALFLANTFQEKGLIKLQQTVKIQEGANNGFKRLLQLISALENRLNFLMNIILNGLLLWDLNCLYRIERWMATFKSQFPKWIQTSSFLDSLISLAVFNFNHPDYTTPDIQEKSDHSDFLLDIRHGRHPLLYPEASIPNHLYQPATLNLFLITGANMAGKSTFLRMVGLNMILAMAGANVAAQRMVMTPVSLFTSMRTSDSLFSHSSFFHAELKKLQWIMEQVRAKKPVYIMLDEILKGTNSKDQHLGAAALISKIISLGGRGLIATHDIELTQLAQQFPEKLKNIAFEIELEGDKMVFNYQYKDGVCQNMNASILMKQMGII